MLSDSFDQSELTVGELRVLDELLGELGRLPSADFSCGHVPLVRTVAPSHEPEACRPEDETFRSTVRYLLAQGCLADASVSYQLAQPRMTSFISIRHCLASLQSTGPGGTQEDRRRIVSS